MDLDNLRNQALVAATEHLDDAVIGVRARYRPRALSAPRLRGSQYLK